MIVEEKDQVKWEEAGWQRQCRVSLWTTSFDLSLMMQFDDHDHLRDQTQVTLNYSMVNEDGKQYMFSVWAKCEPISSGIIEYGEHLIFSLSSKRLDSQINLERNMFLPS